ncbi:unnamed protein product [Rotaria sp. Silwood1]|nr:unnamed protein product [Rotaria sp. Silwood1]
MYATACMPSIIQDPLSFLCGPDDLSIDRYEFLQHDTSIQVRFYRWIQKMKKQWNIEEEKLIVTTIVAIVTKLHASSNSDPMIISDLFQVILSNGFPRLRICTVMDIGSVPFNDEWTGSLNLQILNVEMKTNKDEEKLRLKLPYVRQLTTHDSLSIDPFPSKSSYIL